MAADHCVYACAWCRKVEAFEAEDGKQYIFDTEAKKWVTPEDKIEEDLEALREVTGETKVDFEAAQELKRKKHQLKSNGKNGSHASIGAKHDEGADDTASPASTSAGASHAAEKKAADEVASSDPSNSDEKRRRKKKKKSEKWQKSKTKTWVYVNGLPLDVTIQEVHDHFAKCGVIQQDLVAGTPRIKLYENKEFGGLNVRPTLRVGRLVWGDVVTLTICLYLICCVPGRRVRVLHERSLCGAGGAAPGQVVDPTRVRCSCPVNLSEYVVRFPMG